MLQSALQYAPQIMGAFSDHQTSKLPMDQNHFLIFQLKQMIMFDIRYMKSVVAVVDPQNYDAFVLLINTTIESINILRHLLKIKDENTTFVSSHLTLSESIKERSQHLIDKVEQHFSYLFSQPAPKEDLLHRSILGFLAPCSKNLDCISDIDEKIRFLGQRDPMGRRRIYLSPSMLVSVTERVVRIKKKPSAKNYKDLVATGEDIIVQINDADFSDAVELLRDFRPEVAYVVDSAQKEDELFLLVEDFDDFWRKSKQLSFELEQKVSQKGSVAQWTNSLLMTALLSQQASKIALSGLIKQSALTVTGVMVD